MYHYETAIKALLENSPFTRAEHIAKHTKRENTYDSTCPYCTNDL